MNEGAGGADMRSTFLRMKVIFFQDRAWDRPADRRVNWAGLYASVWADEVLQESELSVWVQAVRDCIPEA